MWQDDLTGHEWALEQWITTWERAFELAEKKRAKRDRDLKQWIKRKRAEGERHRAEPGGPRTDRAEGGEPRHDGP
jgi:hypothetical protein